MDQGRQGRGSGVRAVCSMTLLGASHPRREGIPVPWDPASQQREVRAEEVEETGIHTPEDPVSDETSLWPGAPLLMRGA